MIGLEATNAILHMLQHLKNDAARRTWFRLFLRGQPEADHAALTDFFEDAIHVVDGTTP